MEKVNMDNASDVDIMKNILNIGRRRQRAIYYRKDGTPTTLLPADPYSKLSYMAKGLTLKPPVVEVPPDGKVHCPLCEFTTEKAVGLRTHLNVHVSKDLKTDKEEVK